jgi:hypothetical protein
MTLVYHIEDIEVRASRLGGRMAVAATAIGSLLRHASRYIVGKNENAGEEHHVPFVRAPAATGLRIANAIVADWWALHVDPS